MLASARVPGTAGAFPPVSDEPRTTLTDAIATAPFWLLAGSFWVCGYTSSGLIMTHLIPHATEHGSTAVRPPRRSA